MFLYPIQAGVLGLKTEIPVDILMKSFFYLCIEFLFLPYIIWRFSVKKTLAIICSLSLAILFAYPALGQPVPQLAKDRQINELSNRVAILDSTWGRFQIGGNFELDTTSTLSQGQKTIAPPGFNQQLGVSLLANIDQNLQLSIKTSQLGGWGLKYQSVNSNASPITMPFQVDQAFLKLSHPESLDYLGRFQFSLGPLGMMADFYANPVEGIALQKIFKSFHAIGIYSRVNTEYLQGTNQISTTEDYLAARVGWSNQSTVVGFNLVPGLTGETDFSIDCSNNTPNSKFAAELGWYSFNSKMFPDYKVGWTPGILLSYGKKITANTYLQFKTGFMGPKFMPLYSSLAHSSGELREWFIPNSQGIELDLQNTLQNGYGLENRLIVLTPIINYNQPDYNYRLRSYVVKHYTPVNQLQLGIDLKSFPDSVYQQLFLSWILQF
jgi:hypothetical protein